MRKKKGFTLAEVLITLGIIGVVAALTLPTLISNYQKIALETAYKKGLSVAANAIQLAMAKNETPGDITNLPLTKCYEYIAIDRLLQCLAEENEKLFAVTLDARNIDFDDNLKGIKYDINNPTISSLFFSPAYAVIQIQPDHVWQLSSMSFLTPDGIVYGYSDPITDAEYNLIGLTMLMDVNGPKNPNKLNSDLFLIAISKQGKVVDMTCLMSGTCTDEDYEKVGME